MTEPHYYRDWINWLLTWPEMPELHTFAEMIRHKEATRTNWPPYPENRRLPLKREDV